MSQRKKTISGCHQWDNDDGGDRQGSDPELGPENDDAEGEGTYPYLVLH